MKKFFSSLLVLLMVLQCFIVAVPTAFASTTEISSADIVTADDSSVVYYEEDAESVQVSREKSDVASVGVASDKTTLEIIKQPVSVSAKKGAQFKVTFSANGEGLTYKWYYKNAGDSKFTRTTTFTSNTYATTMTDARNGRQIYCVVSDKYGNSLKTNTVSLIMKTSLVISEQPVSVQVQKGTTAKVSVTAQGEGLTYKWYYKNAGANKFALTTTFTSNVYSVKMTDARNGRQVYCVVSDKYGNIVKSDVVSLSMGAVLKITKQPQSVVVVSGATAKVSFSVSGEGLQYNWYYKNAGVNKFSRTSAFTSNSYAVTMTSGRNGRQIYCVVTDKFGNSVQTDTVTLTMGTALEITRQPASVTIPAGKVVNISFDAKGDGLTYNWYYKNLGASKFVYTSTFKSSTYSVEMTKARDGRMLYCEVTDKYGNTVRTNTVVLDLGTSLKITKEPTSVVAHKDYKAKVSFSVQGDGLSYKWYYKNADASAFAITNTFKSNSYSVVMNSHRSGRQVYCVVTDKYGDSVKTETVTITMDHIFGDWEVYRAATAEREGVERRSCSVCSYYKDRTIPKLTAVYYITTDLGTGTTAKVGVPESGKYVLENPKREGYSFAGWKTADGNDFPRQGVIESDTTVTALWNLDGTDTLRELVDRTNAGVEVIMITADIVISKPIYISYNTKIYSDGDFALVRDPNFAGDMFVVGEDNKGQSGVLLNRDAVLTLGGGEGTLTIDGNRDNVKVEIVGSAVFATDSSVVNLYDGVRIANNKKLGNERIYKYTGFISTSTGENAGGAGILNLNATVNMYGGVIENNLVSTVHKVIDNEDGTQTSKESFGCGGGVYNRGQFNMYGGKICNNEALRGGGFYTDRVAYIVSGEISDNIAHYYGAGISTSSGQHADLHIGSEGEGETILIDGNHSYRAGGAIYSNTSSPIIIYGNAVFSNNRSDSSGGVIYSAGPITARNAVFDSNSCYGSGGAIYNHYTKAEFTRRLMDLSECTFTNNSANMGGAVILSASDTVADTGLGTYATIKDCNFIGNIATNKEAGSGNGGAIYVTRKSETIISRCRFEENTASLNAGAVAAHSEAHVDLVDCEFVRNTANLGGGLYTSSESKVELKNVLFDSNKSVLNENGGGGNGGAVYVSLAKPTFKNVDFVNNSAENHAGAVYMHATTLQFDDTCTFDSNSAAAHGGAFYLTYRTLEDGTKDGSVLKVTDIDFKNNSAMAGGAISIRSACDAQLDNVKFTNNSVAGFADTKNEGNNEGGGAVYVGYGSLTLNDVTALGNTASDFGGAINAVGSTVTISGGTYSENTSNSGGMLNSIGASEITINSAQVNNNESVYDNKEYNNSIGGGAINLNTGKLNITDTCFDGNKSGYYGGAVIAANAEVQINNTVVKNSTGSTGAALMFRAGSNVKLDNVSILDNVSKYNGVLYANGGTLEAVNVTASGNTSVNGGVLYASGASTQVMLKDLTWSGNTASSGGAGYVSEATVTATNCTFTENTANLGGAFYAKKGNLDMQNTLFATNSAVRTSGGSSGNGGAISMSGGTVVTDSTTRFTQNSAENHAGAVYVSYTTDTTETESITTTSSLVATGTAFTGNSAMAGGAVSVRTGCSAELNNLTLENNSAEGFVDTKNEGNNEGGGAVYVGYGSLTLNDVTAFGNTASDFGGAINAVDSTVTISGGTYSENTSNSGGMLNSISASEITINSAQINNNESVYDNKEYNNSIGGGAICASGGSLNIIDTVLDSNKTKYYAGTILASNVDVQMSGNTEVKNSYGGTGGALYFKNTSVADISGVKITDNTATTNGVVYVNNSIIDMNNVTATGNKAANGGVLYASNVNTNIKVNDSTFTQNNANNGGIINVTNATVEFTDSTLSNNTAKNGAVVYSDNAKITVDNSDVKNNVATSCAGVAYATAGDIVVTGGEISENAAPTGGVFWAELANITVDSADVSNNTASSAGGVGYTKDGSFEIKNSSVTENSAQSHAGVLYVKYTEVTFDASVFNKNTSGNNGGVLYLAGAKGTIKNDCTFTENSAVNHGGVVYDVYMSAVNTEEEQRDKAVGELYVTGGTFEGNTALSGAAVSIRSGCDAVFDGTKFSHNSVAGFAGENDGDGEGGGAVYVGYGSVTLNDVTANKNTASDFGGVIEAVSSTVTINGGSFSENSAVSGSVLRVITKSNVTVNNAEFTDNAGESYGVIYQNTGSITMSGVNASGNTALQGSVLYASNASVKVTVENSTFSNNTANLGGALNINSGTALIKDSTFTQNKAVKNASGSYGNGGAININAATVTATGNNVFESNTAQGHGGAVYVTYSTVNNEKVGGTLNMTDGLFENNTASSGGAISSRTSGTVILEGTELTSNNATSTANNEGGGAIYTNTNDLTLTRVTMDGNSSAYYGGAILSSDATVTINGNSVIKNSEGTTGAAMCIIGTSEANITDTEIVDNNASLNGVLYINNSAVEFDKVTATGNKAASGGVIFASNANTKITVADSTFTQNNANNGAVANIANGKIDFVGGNIYENTAKYGAVVYSNNGKVSFDGSTITKNVASSNAGVAYTTDGTLNFVNAVVSENSANSNGGAIYVKYTPLTITDSEFTKNTTNAHGGVCYLGGAQATVVNSEFSENSAVNHGGVFYDVYLAAVNTEEEQRDKAVGDLSVTGGTFEGNTAMAGAVVSIRSGCDAEFNGSSFINNSAAGCTDEKLDGDGEGGGAIYVGYASVTLNDVTATGNTASDFGGVVDSAASKVTISGGSYSGNTTKSGAVVYALGNSTVTMTDVNAFDNVAERGGVLLANGSGVKTTVTGGEFKNNTAQLGGAMNIASGSLNVSDAKFTQNHAVKNDAGSNGNGGAIVITVGTITATGDNVFDGNTAENHGGAVYVSYSTINDAKVGGTLNMTNGVFRNNTAFAGGAISSRTSCAVNLTGTELTGNTATGSGSNDGGGAIYTNDNTMELSGVVMDGNTTGYYGGAITAVNANVNIDDNSEFKNNVGTTGVALQFRGTGTYTLNGVKITDNVSTKGSGVVYITGSGTLNIANLTATGNKNVNGGVVYASGSAKVNIDKSTFTGNTATNLGGAVDHRSSGALTITDSTFNNNTATSGAAINISGSGAVTIKNSTIDGNTAKTMGAGIYHTGSGLLTIDAAAEIKNNTSPTGGGLYLAGSGATTIKNSTIDGNTATTFGGGIYHAGKGLLTVTENTEVKNNTAPSGGGLCVDLGAVASVSSATFDANSATSTDGGAILVADSSEEGKNATTLTITDSVLKNNTAKAKGGAISTDGSSPNLVIDAKNCEFVKNSSLTAGGGAVEIQNANQPNATDPTELKITFKNCTFTENSAATTGGAIEIRTSSSAKIDGITATKNKALKSSSGHGGVIYLTSNFSRLYLTGSVVLSGNTAGGSGTFAYLYNNKYTNPPKIYTTDSNTAAWYKEVKGNTSNVAFDLTTMP